MALKYGDSVILVQKSLDPKAEGGYSVRRVNAIVLASTSRMPTSADRKPIPDSAVEEHLDVAFPDPGLVTAEGQALNTRNVASIFRLAYDVGPWRDGAFIGWEFGPAVKLASENKSLAAEVAAKDALLNQKPGPAPDHLPTDGH